MKARWLALSLAVLGATPALAATGWFSDYLLVTTNLTGEGDYYWIGSDPGFGTQFQNHDFGDVVNLRITGADMRYWSTTGRDGGSYFWRIDSGTATEDIWSQTYLGGNDFQGTDSTDYTVTTGLAIGNTYTLNVWAKSWGGEGDSWLNNGGSNYQATFNLVPEPSTALLALAGLAGVRLVRRRRH